RRASARDRRLSAGALHRQAAMARRGRCSRRGPQGRWPRRSQVITLPVNGKTHRIDVDPDTPLLYVLRNELALNGAKFGCGLGQCGACTVLLDDKPVFSCLVPVVALGERKVRTIEGLPTALPTAFEAEQAAQCGYC